MSYQTLEEESLDSESINPEKSITRQPENSTSSIRHSSQNGFEAGTAGKMADKVGNVKTAAQLKVETVGTVMTAGQAKVKLHAVEPSNSSNSSMSLSKSASDIEGFQCPAGDRYVRHESVLEQTRSVVGRVVDNFIFRAATLLLIAVDLCIVAASITIMYTKAEDINTLLHLDTIALVFSSYFMLEVSLRIFAQRPKIFFRQPLEIIDFLVVFVAFVIVIVDMALESNLSAGKVVAAGRFIRLIRFFMLVRTMTQKKHLAKSTRLLVSENKRRFQKDGFDLDLCYITDRLIAMSFPSQGIMSVYRNPIEEVSRFFNTKYPDHYRIYNCCSEREYNEDKYFNNRVRRIMIDDHNVPSLQEMIDFASDVHQWMDADRNNVIAVHCKGGKGRTGTMVCVWLLHCGAFDNAADALDYFASRRTDYSVGKKYQGVETPSQSRYVKYFEMMTRNFAGMLPPSRTLKIVKISVSGLHGIGTGDGRDLIVKIIVGGGEVFEARFGSDANCTTVFQRDTSTITAALINTPELSGDIKVRFESISNIPCDYDDCPWFFWFNTSFIEDNQFSVGRTELDNPHKEKTWKLYKEDFRVTLTFEPVS